ncbi:neural cell adhesion molecule 2-like isoform X2 [Limulus polyphemus]|uniref:Neural cell adhesion molecule 2-like isoform X2 n=1 Tax=Limulus polyphemus TaxID=6850 RepID=A0ABM1SGC1_LIMPO|nr:neural cell adhesion molecule 2-like isoform X2 [Limulus polyphemus]
MILMAGVQLFELVCVVIVTSCVISFHCYNVQADGDPPEEILSGGKEKRPERTNSWDFPRVEIYVFAGRNADLPCNITPNYPDDEISLVLWYNNKSPSPQYSLDSRSGNFDRARHWKSDQLASRAHFHIHTEPAYLQLDHVTSEDESVFTCRVDFERARTRYQEVGLNLIVPPKKPVIKDDKGKVQQSLIGPYNEGDQLILECEVVGGNPRPKVMWWRESVLLDDSFKVTADLVARNVLRIPSLQRHDLMAVFTCEASNNGYSSPTSTSVTVDMNFRPLAVSLQGKRKPLSAGKFAQIECHSVGSRPPAVISWWKGNTRMKSTKSVVSVNGNATTSILAFKPTIKDNGLYLSCVAENPLIEDHRVEAGWTLKIHYLPQLSLRLGSKLRHSHIQEGNDVYFECNVNASPETKDIVWKFEGEEVEINPAAGIIVSNQTLVLQHVKRTGRGRYTCSATNSEGLGESNPVFLRVQYAPVCKPGQKIIYTTTENEPIHVTCDVASDPEDVEFTWSFNNSHDNYYLSNFNFHKTRSTIVYIPKSKYEFGSLSCSASNSVGNQNVPCVYSIVAEGPPEPVQNCTLFNQTQNGIGIDCTDGYDGNLMPHIFVEVYDIMTGSIVANFSSFSLSFFMRSLPPGLNFVLKIYVVSHQGRSQPLVLKGRTLHIPETQSRQGKEWKLLVNPVLIALLFIVVLFILIALCAVVILKRRQISQRKANQEPEEKLPKYTSHPEKEIIPTEEFAKDFYEEKCPDVIPDSKYLEIPVCNLVSQEEGRIPKQICTAAGSSTRDFDGNFEIHEIHPTESENLQTKMWKDPALLEGISSEYYSGEYIDLQTGYRRDVAKASSLTSHERHFKQTDV